MESKCIDSAWEEIETFRAKQSANSALVFPPCNNFLRFRIHQLVQESFPDLQTFSVGQGKERRIVIGYKTVQKRSVPQSAPVREEQHVIQKKKRPDRDLYVPRQRREVSVPSISKDLMLKEEEGSLGQLSEGDILVSKNPKDLVFKEIKDILGQGVVIEECGIDLPLNNGKDDFPHPSSANVILEIYDFDASLKTCDLNAQLSKFKNKYSIKWVDDTHALAIFVTESWAKQALKDNYSILKLRPLEEASEKSQSVANMSYFNLNFNAQPRPETSTLVAKRMLGGALGLKLVSPVQESQEKEKLRKAKLQKNRIVI